VLADIERTGLPETKRLIMARDGKATSIEADVTEELAVKALFSEALDAHGRIDMAAASPRTSGKPRSASGTSSCASICGRRSCARMPQQST